jgi:hypothetical protein
MSATTYPVHVDATLEAGLSRWLWLVKWLLTIPHFIVLLFLWAGFVIVSVIAFVAILFTGRYPRALFEFNVGVLRWSWRVAYYSCSALGTDRYPPFALADVPDYPAHFDVDYPAHLSRGLVLVKWWLLAIPHYLVVGVFVGGGTWALSQTTDNTGGGPGLIGLMVLVAAVVLTFTGRYPQQIFDFVLGMNRWALRVAAYAGLMTDDYPPFRIDMGGHEPSGTMTVPALAPTTDPPPPPAAPARPGWTGGRVVSLIIGSLLGLASLGLLAAGGVATWATSTQRDAAGYLTTDTRTFDTSSYAITSDGIDLGTATDVITPGDVLGTVRLRATATDPAKHLFIGVGRKDAVERYLAGVGRSVITDWANGHSHQQLFREMEPPSAPSTADVWTAQAAGAGTQTLTWRPAAGQWVVVVMNENGSAGVSVTADAAATVPDLRWIATGLLAAGALALASGVVLVAVSAARASR